MGVAKAVGINVDKLLDEIRNDPNPPVDEFEKRRRALDIEIAISKAILTLLSAGGSGVTITQINNAIITQVQNPYDAFRAAESAGANPPWPFRR